MHSKGKCRSESSTTAVSLSWVDRDNIYSSTSYSDQPLPTVIYYSGSSNGYSLQQPVYSAHLCSTYSLNGPEAWFRVIRIVFKYRRGSLEAVCVSCAENVVCNLLALTGYYDFICSDTVYNIHGLIISL